MQYRRMLPRILLGAAVWGLLAMAGCNKSDSEQDEGEAKYNPVPVSVRPAELTTLRPRLELIGNLEAIPEATAVICPQVGGTIEKVLVVEGQTVSVGDELFTLDARFADAAIAKAAATVQEKAAILDRLKRGPLPQEIQAARHEVTKFKAAVESIHAKVSALEPLRKTNEVSAVQFEAVRSSLRGAQAEQAAAEARLALLEAGARPEDITEAEANLALAKAEKSAAELARKCCRVVSPIKGVVTRVAASRGMSVDRTNTLATVVDMSSLFARLRIPNAYLGKVLPGADVQVQVTSLPEQNFPATIARLGGQADMRTGDVDAFAKVANNKGLLRPGLGCHLSVALPEIANALAIPVAAVADRSGTPVVTVIQDNKARETEVKLGTQTANQVQVLEGLAPGDLVVTENGYGLPNDCPVRIIAEGAPASQGP